MKLGKLLLLFVLLITPVLAIQSHPISQIARTDADRDADLNLSKYDILLKNVRGYTGTRYLSLMETNSDLYGIDLGLGGLACSFCIDTSDISDDSITGSKILDGTINNSDISSDAGIVKSKISDDGTWETSEIPNLDASKVTTGIFNLNRIPSIGSNKLSVDANSLYNVTGGAAVSDGSDVTFNNNITMGNNGCIQNSLGECKISFDSDGNLILDL